MTCTITSNGKECGWECKNEHEPPYTAIKLFMIQKIRHLFSVGYTDFYVNCEYGIPLWAAEAVCLFKETENLHLHIVVPYEEQCRDWSENLRDRYYHVHELADSVTFADTKCTERSYMLADMEMAGNSDLILVFGCASDNLHIAKCAQEIDVPILYLGE